MKPPVVPFVAGKGFTLVELLITVLIMVVVVSIAAPAFDSMLSSNNTLTAVRRLSTSFAYARSEAVARSVEVRVCSSTSAAGCVGNSDTQWAIGWLIYIDDDGDGDYQAASDILLRVESIIELRVASAATVNNADDDNFSNVCFNALGEECTIADAVTLTFSDDNESASLTLLTTGAVNL